VGQNLPLVIGLFAVFEAYHVAAACHVAVRERNALRGGFQRSAAVVDQRRVRAEDGQDGCGAAGLELRRAVYGAAQDAALGKPVDARLAGGFQRRFAAESGYGVVRHAVADDEQKFHKNHLGESIRRISAYGNKNCKRCRKFKIFGNRKNYGNLKRVVYASGNM